MDKPKNNPHLKYRDLRETALDTLKTEQADRAKVTEEATKTTDATTETAKATKPKANAAPAEGQTT